MKKFRGALCALVLGAVAVATAGCRCFDQRPMPEPQYRQQPPQMVCAPAAPQSVAQVQQAPCPPKPAGPRKYVRLMTHDKSSTGAQAGEGEESGNDRLEITIEGDANAPFDPLAADPLLRQPAVRDGDDNLTREANRLRGPNKNDKPPFFTPPPDTRSVSPEEARRLRPQPEYIPSKENRN